MSRVENWRFYWHKSAFMNAIDKSVKILGTYSDKKFDKRSLHMNIETLKLILLLKFRVRSFVYITKLYINTFAFKVNKL